MDTHEHAHEHPGGHTHIHHNTRAVKNRLARIAGHLRAVENMVDEGRDCSEILIQLAAVRAAVNGVCRLILTDHIDHCIVAAAARGDHAAIEDLHRAIDMLVK